MFSSFKHVLKSFDIQYRTVSLNANEMTFQSDLWNKLLLAITQSKQNQVSLM